MNRILAIKEILLENSGFTLIELLMVVVILGILAAVVIPQFSSSSKDAKVSALKSNLSGIRGALELYALQHTGEYPVDPNGTGETFVNRLIQYTDKDHGFQTSQDGTHIYGPYLKQGFPKNPLTEVEANADKVLIDDGAEIRVFAIDEAAAGWLFKPQTGEFIANLNAYKDY